VEEARLEGEGPDGDVLRRIAAGEPVAESELFEKYLGLVVGAARWSGLRRSDAEELAQDVLLMMIERARAGGLKDTVAAWLRHVTRNRAIDWKRKSGVRRAQDKIVVQELKAARGSERSNTVSYQQFAVRKALQAVRIHDERQRTLGRDARDSEILGWISDGATNAELAEYLGVNENAARQRRLRALRRLRDHVEKIYSEPAA
jgi:RNA polymerase sigma factor (sigma-70 family)